MLYKPSIMNHSTLIPWFASVLLNNQQIIIFMTRKTIFLYLTRSAQLKDINTIGLVKTLQPLIVNFRYNVIQQFFAVFNIIHRILKHGKR